MLVGRLCHYEVDGGPPGKLHDGLAEHRTDVDVKQNTRRRPCTSACDGQQR